MNINSNLFSNLLGDIFRRDDDDGFRCGGNDHDADDRGIDWIQPRQDPDRLQDDQERLGKDWNRCDRDYNRCQNDLERYNNDFADGNWGALAGDASRYGKDLQRYGHDVQRYDRDLGRYERDLNSEYGFRPQQDDDDDCPQTLQQLAERLSHPTPSDPDFFQDIANITSQLKLR